MSTDKTAIETVVNELGLTVESEFIPFSRSRNAKPNAKPSDMSLNWEVTLVKSGKPVLTTDYSAGCGHCPSYPKTYGKWTDDDFHKVRAECETGRPSIGHGRNPIEPDSLDVIHSLVSDSDVIDCDSFESWASDLGYDADSRKAEAIYRYCLAIALKLRNAIGDAGMSKLREAFQDY